MNESEWKPLTKDDPRLTAYVLGELDDAELRRVEAALKEDPALRVEVEAIRRTSGALGAALMAEAGRQRDAEWANMGTHHDRRRRKQRRRRFPALYFLIGGLAAACVAIVVVVRRGDVERADAARKRVITLAVGGSEPGGEGGEAQTVGTPSYLPENAVFAGGGAEGDDGFVPIGTGGPVALPLAAEDEGYARVRRMISAGRLPTRSEVRIGDLVNAFSYDRASMEDASLTTRVESGVAPWAPDHVLVRVQVDAREPVQVARPPTTLMILADIPPVPQQQARVDAIRENLRLLVNRLRPDDRLGIVVWTGQARVELEPTALANRAAVQTAIDQLGVRSGRKVDDALVTTLELAHGDAAGRGATWRVLICSDGGHLPGADESRALDLLENSETKKAFSRAVWGPVPSDNDLIARLAAQGEAKEATIGTSTDAQRVIAGLINDPVRVAATDTTLKLKFDPRLVSSYRILGYSSGDGDSATIRGGEMLEGQSCTTLVEIVPASPAAATAAGLVKVSLMYHDADADLPIEHSFEAPARKAWDASSPDFKFSAAVAGFGLALRAPVVKGGLVAVDQVKTWAREGTGEVPSADRSEFLALLDSARHIVR